MIEDNSQQATLAAQADAHLDFVDDFLQLRQQMPTSEDVCQTSAAASEDPAPTSSPF